MPDQLPSDKYDMDRLLRNLIIIKTTPTMLNEHILIRKINKGTLTFKPTPTNLETLRKAGATEELLKVIARKGGMPDSAPSQTELLPPPKPKQGRLTVTCKPVDCIVSVDKNAIGQTTMGELKDHPLPEGSITVSASSKNYIPDQRGQVVQIKDGVSTRLGFVFTLDSAALLEKGHALFSEMIKALGGEQGLKDAEFFSASGRMDIHEQVNKPTAWPFLALVHYPLKAKFTVNKNNKKYEILKTDAGFLWKPNQPGQEFNELEGGINHLLDCHITQLVDLLRGPGSTVDAEKLTFETGEEVVFRVAREAYKYKVTLNAESRPREISFESGGLNSGLKIQLTDYAQQGAAFIPMTTQVLLPGAEKRGVIVHYDTIAVNPPGVKEDDFKPKKGYLNRSR